MKKNQSIKPKRKKTKPFIINHSEVEKAVSDFLAQGGKITKLKPEGNSNGTLIKTSTSDYLADDFLSEN